MRLLSVILCFFIIFSLCYLQYGREIDASGSYYSGDTLSFKETLKDGTTTEFDGQVSLKRTGGGVNGVIEFTLNITVCSEIKITDPLNA